MTLDNKCKVNDLTIRDWRDIMILIDKHQSKGKKGMMDKIINNAVIWGDIGILEEKVRQVCFQLDKVGTK